MSVFFHRWSWTCWLASTFVAQCTALLASEDTSVWHRTLEVVSAKLSAAQLAPAELPALVPPLTQLALTETQPHTQQLALLGVRQLAKLLPEPIALKEAAETFSCRISQVCLTQMCWARPA